MNPIESTSVRLFDSLVHATPDGSWLGANRFDARLERLLSAMDNAGVTRACLVAIADYIDNEYVLDVAKAYPDRFVPIASVNPAAIRSVRDVVHVVEDLAPCGFAGLKLHPRLNHYDPLDPRSLAAIEAAGTAGLVVLIDTLFRQPTTPTRHIPDIVDEIAKRCPTTRIVLLHSGGASMLDLFELGRMHSNLMLDLSFTLLRYAGSSIDLDIRFLCQHLDQRVVFGSDFPEYVPAQALERLLFLSQGLSRDKLDNVLYHNLARVFDNWGKQFGRSNTR